MRHNALSTYFTVTHVDTSASENKGVACGEIMATAFAGWHLALKFRQKGAEKLRYGYSVPRILMVSVCRARVHSHARACSRSVRRGGCIGRDKGDTGSSLQPRDDLVDPPPCLLVPAFSLSCMSLSTSGAA
jgi:hypothetical protein